MSNNTVDNDSYDYDHSNIYLKSNIDNDDWCEEPIKKPKKKEQIIEEIKIESTPEVKTFDELPLKENLLRGIYSMGFEIPSVIQSKAILPIIQGRDLIAQAQSGTGKTVTFLTGSMEKIDLSINKPQVIILCPNRELAQQIYFNFEGLNTYLKIKGTLIMGGTQVEDNFKALDEGVQLIIGTPGRVYDMMKRYVLKTECLKCFVMDEADEMLSRGFKNQIYEIFQFIPKQCQVCIFSATMPSSALELSEQFMNNPEKILVNVEEVSLKGIKQYYLGVEHESWKIATLFDLYERLQINQTIIFVNSKRKAEYIKEKLEENNFIVSCIHSNMSQLERDKIMKSFRLGESRVLVATDVIARGIDIQQVSIVINYDIPKYCEIYIHRIGRSGRYGRKGVAINFVTEREFGQLERIQKFYQTEIDPLPENIKQIIS